MVIPRKRPTGSSKADPGKTGAGSLPTSHFRAGSIRIDARAETATAAASVCGRSRTARPSQGAFTMNQTQLHRPTSRGSLFQWSVTDRTVAACGTDRIERQQQSELALTARFADDCGRFPARHDRRHMQRKVLLGRALRCVPDRDVGSAEKKRVSALFRTLIGLDSRRTPRRGGHIPFRIIEPSP
jgi:hypothetical protein